MYELKNQKTRCYIILKKIIIIYFKTKTNLLNLKKMYKFLYFKFYFDDDGKFLFSEI